MNEQETLSDAWHIDDYGRVFYPEKDVKDFIKKLKEEANKEGKNEFVDCFCGEYEFDREKFKRFLDKLVGKELIE